MQSDQSQFIIISGIYGSLLDPSAPDIHELHAALKLLRSRNIPLIFTTDKTADEAFLVMEHIGHDGPIVVESGGGIYIPENALKVPFNYQRSITGYRIIELGLLRNSILEKLHALKRTAKYKIVTFSELSPDEFPAGRGLSHEDILAHQGRRYSESLFFEGNEMDLPSFETELENVQLRLHNRDTYAIVTGDHDGGSAVRFLIQLYREEFSPKQIVTIGIGDSFIYSPMLHAVDLPVLLRQVDGHFDSRVGRRSLRFTKNHGHPGWSQAVISLISEESEK